MDKSKRSLTQGTRRKLEPSDMKNNTQTNQKSVENKSSIPQNFNSYRHVITRTTTGDDLSWVLNLREKSAPLLTPAYD